MVTAVTVIIEGPDLIEVYRPPDVPDVLTWHELRPDGVAVRDPERQVWMVTYDGQTLWCRTRVAAWYALNPPREELT